MASKQGITTAKGFQGKVPFAENANYASSAGSATKINGVEIKKVNGVLKIGDIIIPQRKPIVENIEFVFTRSPEKIIDVDSSLISELKEATLEVLISGQYYKLKMNNGWGSIFLVDTTVDNEQKSPYFVQIQFWVDATYNNLTGSICYEYDNTELFVFKLQAIYKIIE